MYRILIVDDERIERNGIRFLMKQQDIKLITQEAGNGKEALEYLKDHTVDILLTDVKMPFMDGISLIENVSKLYPQMKMIIFSGYSEFEYAKNAMKMGVTDYILKPVDPVEFRKTIQKVVSELEDREVELQRQQESLGFMKEHILYCLLNGTKEGELQEKSRFFDFTSVHQYKRMFLLEAEKDFFGKVDNEFGLELSEKLSVRIQYLNMNPMQSILLFEQDNLNYELLAREILDYIERKYQEKCFIAISDQMGASSCLSSTLDCLEQRMENKFYQPQQQIYGENCLTGETTLARIDDDTLMKQMKQDIKMKDIESLQLHFDGLCEKYRGQKNFSHVYIKFIFSNLLKDCYENLPNVNEQQLNDEIDRLYRASDFSVVMDTVRKNIDRLQIAFSQNPQMVHREIESIKAYIYEHYGEEIGVDMLADKVFMAPSYLSHVFKKETGQNLSKFIKAYRMEKARELLEGTHEKIVNISYAVGYPNVSYFCQSFREFYGVSPQKFRNSGEEA